MKRHKITTRERAQVFLDREGLCHICQMKVIPGQDWDVSHEIPLEAGGKDDPTNWYVAHRKCHRVQTSEIDIPLITKTRHVRFRHMGATKSKNPMPGGRGSRWKKKMDGTVVPRR